MNKPHWRSPEEFGKPWWRVFHDSTAAYPTKPTVTDISIYSNFYVYYGYVLPCMTCSKDYSATLEQNNRGEQLYFSLMRGKLFVFIWGVDIHNDVNRRLGKPTKTYYEAGVFYGFSVQEIDFTLSSLKQQFGGSQVAQTAPRQNLQNINQAASNIANVVDTPMSKSNSTASSSALFRKELFPNAPQAAPIRRSRSRSRLF
jgi:hypothetical protein